jgi:hypothetical protein
VFRYVEQYTSVQHISSPFRQNIFLFSTGHEHAGDTTTGTRSFRLRWLLERWLLERWLLERPPLLGPSAAPAHRLEGEDSSRSSVPDTALGGTKPND